MDEAACSRLTAALTRFAGRALATPTSSAKPVSPFGLVLLSVLLSAIML
jgi:hypothetical protein